MTEQRRLKRVYHDSLIALIVRARNVDRWDDSTVAQQLQLIAEENRVWLPIHEMINMASARRHVAVLHVEPDSTVTRDRPHGQ